MEKHFQASPRERFNKPWAFLLLNVAITREFSTTYYFRTGNRPPREIFPPEITRRRSHGENPQNSSYGK